MEYLVYANIISVFFVKLFVDLFRYLLSHLRDKSSHCSILKLQIPSNKTDFNNIVKILCFRKKLSVQRLFTNMTCHKVTIHDNSA